MNRIHIETCRFASENDIRLLATHVQEITGSSLSACLKAVSIAKQRKAPLSGLPEKASIVNEAVQYMLERLHSQHSP